VNSQFEYKGYVGSAEIDIEGKALVGKLLFIRDTITYSALVIEDLEAAFHEAVDDYLAACAEEGTEPDFPCKGSFNVRIGPELHRKVAIAARRQGVGLNEFVCFALNEVTQPHGPQTIVHNYLVAGESHVAFTAMPTNLTMFAGTVDTDWATGVTTNWATGVATNWGTGDDPAKH
jgi:predicted HicB family RNase H-like nuclease